MTKSFVCNIIDYMWQFLSHRTDKKIIKSQDVDFTSLYAVCIRSLWTEQHSQITKLQKATLNETNQYLLHSTKEKLKNVNQFLEITKLHSILTGLTILMATSLHTRPGGQPCSFHRQIPKYLNGNDPEIRFKIQNVYSILPLLKTFQWA